MGPILNQQLEPELVSEVEYLSVDFIDLHSDVGLLTSGLHFGFNYPQLGLCLHQQ